MNRTFWILALLASVLLTTPVHAGISWNNPYRSFNISGLNYGSMEWEKKYGNKQAPRQRGWRRYR
jgi:hypothetical protein